MNLSNDEIQVIVQNGANVCISVEGWTAYDLAVLARVAKRTLSQITLLHADRFTADQLCMIVKEAPGQVMLVGAAESSAPAPAVVLRRSLLRRVFDILSPAQLVKRGRPKPD